MTKRSKPTASWKPTPAFVRGRISDVLDEVVRRAHADGADDPRLWFKTKMKMQLPAAIEAGIEAVLLEKWSNRTRLH
jgi:hypothetical protein